MAVLGRSASLGRVLVCTRGIHTRIVEISWRISTACCAAACLSGSGMLGGFLMSAFRWREMDGWMGSGGVADVGETRRDFGDSVKGQD